MLGRIQKKIRIRNAYAMYLNIFALAAGTLHERSFSFERGLWSIMSARAAG